MTTENFSKAALDFVDQVVDLYDHDDVCDLLLSCVRGFGFDHMALCDLPSSGRPAKLVATWPDAFRERYHGTLYRDDPLARHARGTVEPFAWSEATWDHSRGSREQRVMEEAAAYELEDGFVVPVVGIGGDQSVIGLAGRRMRLDAGDRNGLHLMCVFAHYAISRRRDAVGRMQVAEGLTAAQQDALRYAVFGQHPNSDRGSSRFSPSELCEISHTARTRYGARNTLEAGCIAFMRGEISS